MKSYLYFLIFFISHMIYQFYNMYVARQSSSLTLFSKQYETLWSFLIMALLLFTPILSLANLGFSYGFQLGYKISNNIWLVTVVFISAQMLSTIASALLVFNQSIEKGPFAGFLISIVGLLVANLWK